MVSEEGKCLLRLQGKSSGMQTGKQKINTQVCAESNRQLQLEQIQPVSNADNTRQAYRARSTSLTSFLHKLG